MFNWNNQIRGQGFPVQNPPVQMMSYGPPGQPMTLNAAAMPFQPAQWGHQQQQFPQGMGMMPMIGQQHAQWQQMQQFPPQPPGMFHPQGMRMGMMGGMNPAPPSYPPPEEKPPLPSEPPPPLPSAPLEIKPPLPNEQPKPPLPKEKIGIPSNDGPRPPDEPAPEKPAPPARPPSPDPALLAELEKVKKEEEVFLDQYKQWKKQYDDWRDQNQNHPNKDQYEQYLSQWKTYEGQMESRRISIATQKESLEKRVADYQLPSQTRQAFHQGEKDKFNQNLKEYQDMRKTHSSDTKLYSPNRRGVRTPSKRMDPLGEGENSQKQKHHPIEGDDIGEEDMNLDDEEETAGGGIIESSSHPPTQETWLNNSSDILVSSSEEYLKNTENENGDKLWRSKENSGYGGPSRFPGRSFSGASRLPGGIPRFPVGTGSGNPRFQGGMGGLEPRFSGGSGNGEPRFPGGLPPTEEPRFPGRPTSGERFHERPPSGDFGLPGQLSSGESRFSGKQSSGDSVFSDQPPSGESRFPGRPPGVEPKFPGQTPTGGPRFPGRPSGEPRFPGRPPRGEPRISGRPFGGESRFSSGPQEWGQTGLGPSSFHRGRARGERGIFGQGPRFGWRGGGPRFQGSATAESGGGFSEQENSEWEDLEGTNSGYQDDIGEDATEKGGYQDQENYYGETENESQVYDGSDHNFPNSGRGFLSNRGRGGSGAFQRGRGSDVYNITGTGFQRGRGKAFGRGEPIIGGSEEFSRGGPSFRDRCVRYEEEETEADFYNTPRGFGPTRGRGSWLARGRGGFKGPSSHQFTDDALNNDGEAEDNFEEVERQAQLQYEGEEELENQEHDNFQVGFRGRGRGGMFRGRGRGGFETSFGNESSSQNEGSQYNSQEYGEYENLQTGFGHRGRGTPGDHGHLEPFIGRGRAGMNYGNEGMSRGFQRGRGAFRGRGGHITNFKEEYNDAYGHADEDGGDQFQDQQEAYPVQPTHSGPRGRGRGTTGRPGFGRGTFAAESDDQYTNNNEEFQWNEDSLRPARGRGFGIRRGRGRGADRPENPESRWNDEAFVEKTEVSAEGSVYENRRADNTLSDQGVENVDEPTIKRSRFDTDERDPYGRFPPPVPRDRFDAYGDGYHDPYGRYPDSFSRDPYFDPYAPSPFERLSGYDMYGRYDRHMLEKKSFVPAESIDYGHGEADKEKKKAALQQKEVIDYGHGRVSEPKDDPSALSDRQGSRPPEDRGFNRGRGWDKNGHRDDQQMDFPDDKPYRVSHGRIPETYDYSSMSGQDPSSRKELTDIHGARQSDSPYNTSAHRTADSALDYDHRGRDDSRDNSRDSDHRTKNDFNETKDRNRDNRYGRHLDNRYSRDRDDRYGRDRDNRYDRDRDERYGKDRSTIYDKDSDDPYSRGRDKEDQFKERDRIYSRGMGRDESPRRRISDLDERYDGKRDSPFKKEDFSQGRDFLRREDGSNRLSDARDESLSRSRHERDDQGDPYLSLGHEGLRNLDNFGSKNRWDNRDTYGMTSSRDQRFGAMPGARDVYGDRTVSSPARNSPVVRAPAGPPPLPVAEIKKVEDLLCPPGRQSRPPQLVVIIRGLPGSGKTYVSKLLREKEIKFGGGAPRMLCLDDYFMVEVDKQEVDPDTGKKVKKKVLEYEYEQPLEDAYRQSLLKSFKKTVDDGFFPFIIVDATNEKVVHFSEFWSYAKSRGFQVYVGELNVDITTCIQRNIHNWTEWDIEKVKSNWEPLPNHYIRLDLRWLLQDDSIAEVEMEDTEPNAKEEKEAEEEEKDPEEDEEESGFEGIYKKSKWELDSSEKTLDKLDGIPVSKKHIAEHQSLKDYLQLDQPDQLDDDYFSRESLPGKKRVRWADLEEKKTQNRRRDLGFIVGQTQRDWDRITDDDFATKALNQTKYFYKN